MTTQPIDPTKASILDSFQGTYALAEGNTGEWKPPADDYNCILTGIAMTDAKFYLTKRQEGVARDDKDAVPGLAIQFKYQILSAPGAATGTPQSFSGAFLTLPADASKVPEAKRKGVEVTVSKIKRKLEVILGRKSVNFKNDLLEAAKLVSDQFAANGKAMPLKVRVSYEQNGRYIADQILQRV